MNRIEILVPVLALALLTFLVLTALGIARIGGLVSGRFTQSYYRLFRESDDDEPEFVRLIARNYHNLLELPVLFYTGCLLAYAADLVSTSLVALAWTYVGLRALHTAIHVTYNDLWHRMVVFVTSSLVLMGFWVVLARALLTQR